MERTFPDIIKLLARRPEVIAILVGVLLPNAIFMLGTIGDIGTAPRLHCVFLYLLVAVIVRHMTVLLAGFAYLFVLAYDLAWTVAMSFHLAPSEIMSVLRFIGDVRLYASPLYLGIMTGFAATTGAAIWLIASQREALRRASLLPALLVAMLVSAGDAWLNLWPTLSTGPANAARVEFDSAVDRSGFGEAVLAPNAPNVLLVMVEALGTFADDDDRELLLAPFRAAEIRRRYDVTTGTSPYFGSTTAAEMRELCGSTTPYDALTEAAAAECLPRRLRELGRRTTAIHGFTQFMFDRHAWYPEIGFEHTLFHESLANTLASTCGAVFRGACDAEIGERLPDLLPTSAERHFVYWLTLNTHVPIRPEDARPRLACDDDDTPIDHDDVCQMAEMWIELLERVAALALDPRLAPLEILIVGDHPPPLWSRQGRMLFEPGVVPWIRLSPRTDLSNAQL